MDLNNIAGKWQKKWAEAKVFEANPDSRKKFFATFPYPYINAYQHVGHLFTLMRVEAFSRYKRLQGYNVLFPQGWHATGSPIVNAAKRVKEKEEKQLKIMKDMHIPDSELKKFEEPSYWIDFFMPEFEKDYKMMGMSVDWRRSFHTTSLNPYYDKFIQWQFRKLKEKGYVIKGKFPVVWDPKENMPVGDHDRVEGEGETPQEFILVKHKLEENKYVISATLRQDTILGITNLYVHPDVEYKEITINGENWILGEESVKRLQEQDKEVTIVGTIKGTELIGEKTEEVDGRKVLILPATFLDPTFGTGLVHSVPSDSADDLIALWDFQKNKELIKKYNLDPEEVQAIEPIAVLDTPEYGDIPAKAILEKYGVKHQKERGKLEKIKKELYKLSFHTATFNKKYKDFFSKDISGKKVSEGKDFIKEELLKMGWIDTYYQLTGKVVSRSLTECIVKLVSDQWFIDYNNPQWKEQAHKCLKDMRLYPEKTRSQFDYVIDWLHEWACTREEGLGTRLPWDDKWLIESLSDSTIYMAYYTIVHLITEVPLENIDDNFFDYVFLNKGTKPDVQGIDEMKKNFDYYYPLDFRNSGKDLIQNHLTFFIFNHIALFPEDKWPQSIGTNGWVTVDGQKMSKSLGNMIPVRDMAKQFSADSSRITILNGGEEMDDPNWDTEFARSMMGKLENFHEFCSEQYGKGTRTEEKPIDIWFSSKMNKIIKNATESMEETLFRTAIQHIYFDMQKTIKHYMKRTLNDPQKNLIDSFITSWITMLSPFCPHICEETWESIGKKGFVSEATWPSYDEKKIDEEAEGAEDTISNVRLDIHRVLKLINVKQPKSVKLIISPQWKYAFYSKLKKEMAKTRDTKEILKTFMTDEHFKQHGKEVSKIIPSIVKEPSKLPSLISTQQKEKENIDNAVNNLKEEFGAEINVEISEESKEAKAKNASPGKPAILVE